MSKAIKTTYVSATSTKPSRIRASAEGVPSKLYSVDALQETTQSERADAWHNKAAIWFRDERGWTYYNSDPKNGVQPLAHGQIGPDTHVHCFIEREPVRETDTVELDKLPPTPHFETFRAERCGSDLGQAVTESLFPAEPAPEFFTVILVSSNTNSFGLKSILLLHEDGRGKQILKSPCGGNELPESGDKIEFRGGRFLCGSYECPSDLPTIPADKAAKILKTVRKQSK